LNNITSCLKVLEYIKTDDVLAVPLPPISKIALLQREDFG